MERETVITTLETLARTTAPDGTQQPVDIITALTQAAHWLRAETPPGPSPITRYPAAGARWTQEEDEKLANEYDGGMPLRDIARNHGRSTTAITLRLVHLGRLDPTTVKVRDRSRVA
jgi:hypothetical protein